MTTWTPATEAQGRLFVLVTVAAFVAISGGQGVIEIARPAQDHPEAFLLPIVLWLLFGTFQISYGGGQLGRPQSEPALRI